MPDPVQLLPLGVLWAHVVGHVKAAAVELCLHVLDEPRVALRLHPPVAVPELATAEELAELKGMHVQTLKRRIARTPELAELDITVGDDRAHRWDRDTFLAVWEATYVRRQKKEKTCDEK